MDGLSLDSKLKAISQEKILDKKEAKHLLEIYKLRRQEANKIYVLGLKDYADRLEKLDKLKGGKSKKEKLVDMLMDHHMNRLYKINTQFKKISTRIVECELLITRYQTSCFIKDLHLSQYHIDMVMIKALIATKKQDYLDLHKYDRERFDLRLNKKSYQLILEGRSVKDFKVDEDI